MKNTPLYPEFKEMVASKGYTDEYEIYLIPIAATYCLIKTDSYE